MACNNCDDNNPNSFFPVNDQGTPPCNSDCDTTMDSSCVIFTGSELDNIPTDTPDVEAILIKINDIIGSLPDNIDWESMDFDCLGPLASFTEYLTAVTTLICAHDTSIEALEGSSSLATLSDLVAGINVPVISDCGTIGLLADDTIQEVLTKLKNAICGLQDAVSIAEISWSVCGLSVTEPTTIKTAIEAILEMLCQVVALIPDEVVLPTFDNTDCLGGGETDSLETTVNYLKSILCDTDRTFYPGTLDFGCVTVGTDLQTTTQNILDNLTTLNQAAVVAVDPDYFVLSNVDSGDDCAGKTLTFSGTILNNKVAVDDAETAGFLEDVLVAGSGTTITKVDDTLVIAATANSTVKTDSSDTAGYLEDKIEGDPDDDGVHTVVVTKDTSDPSDLKLILTTSTDWEANAAKILNTILMDSDLLQLFASVACAAPACDDLVQTMSVELSNLTAVTPINIDISLDQNTPSLSLLNGNITLGGASTFSTGAYTITSTVNPATGILVITNNESFNITYNIEVVDSGGTQVPGTTATSGTILTSATATFSPLVMGNVNGSILKIDLEEIP